MALKMWMLDVAREQSPTLDHLFQFAMLTQEAGYDALGLYLEHRYAYPSAPWAHGRGSITPETIRRLQHEFPSLQIVPFINLLGHMEGLIYTEEGKRFREERFAGMQACPCNPGFVDFTRGLVGDIVAAFDSELIHIGGDETWQLGHCDECKAFVENHGKAELYAQHFGPLAHMVVEAGRTPAVWGDMFLEHPQALEGMPNETVIFDWQYFGGVVDTSKKFDGHRVVGCPTLHVYNAPWFHLAKSEENVRHVCAESRNLHGTCLTTWECGLLGAYDTLFPAIKWAGGDLGGGIVDAYTDVSDKHGEWARLMGVELEQCGGVFAFSGHRNKLKSRTLLYSNPFLSWMHHGEELSGEVGDSALRILDRADLVAPSEAEKGVCIAVRGMIEFARIAEEAHVLYAKGEPEAAIGKLTATRTIFDMMRRVAVRTNERIGGSRADVERCKRAVDHVDKVIVRLRDFGRGQLGYLPAWEVITHPMFVPHDQACWWLVNRWGKE